MTLLLLAANETKGIYIIITGFVLTLLLLYLSILEYIYVNSVFSKPNVAKQQYREEIV